MRREKKYIYIKMEVQQKAAGGHGTTRYVIGLRLQPGPHRAGPGVAVRRGSARGSALLPSGKELF